MDNSRFVGRRAGFWRRFAALAIDAIVVLLPFTIFAAVLFGLSGGRIQTENGLLWPSCVPVLELPDGLAHQPLEDFTFIEECRLAFAGMDAGKVLRVGIQQPEQPFGQSASQTYWLDVQGIPITGVISLSVIAFFAYPVYAILMESRRGQTIGKRILRIKVVDPDAPNTRGISITKAFRRQLSIYLMTSPTYIVQIYVAWALIPSSESFLEIVNNSVYAWLDGLSLLSQLIFAAVVVVALARKRDPIYDEFAKTAVVVT